MITQTLKSIFLFCMLHVVFCIYSNAQIVYTDVNPDQTFSTNNSVYHLDMNNDGTTDYDITIVTYYIGVHPNAGIRLTPSAGNNVSITSSYYPSAFNYGALISSANTWATTNSFFTMARDGWNMNQHTGQLVHVTLGNWLNVTDKYLGLKFISGGNTYYGWARLDAHVYSNGTGNFTIKDYAYNSIADDSILAGQTCSPQAAIIANGPLSFCAGGTVILTSKNSGNTLTYQWKKNNINITGATNKSYTATTAGDYKVKVTDAINNCYKTSGLKTVTVPCKVISSSQDENIALSKSDDPQSPMTTPNCNCSVQGYGCGGLNPGCVMYCHSYCTICTVPLSLSASGSLSFCSGDSVVLTVNRTGTYQWKKNGVNIAGATSQSYSAKTPGTFKCKVTNTFCGAELSPGKKVTVPCRNSNENFPETLEHLSLFPNPATNSVTIKFPSDEAGEIQIVNLFGQIVFSEKINREQTTIDVSIFSEGMYVLRWSSGENFETKTFSVVR